MAVEKILINDFSLNNQKLFDKVKLEQTVPYDINGLTYRSNNTSIHPRDEAGNIILQENSETNPLLIIESVTPNIVNSSVLRVIDTTFRYFKFPVASSVDVPEIFAEDLQLDLTELLSDPIYARYRPTDDVTITNVGSSYSGMPMGTVVDGLSQVNVNCYTVSKEAKNSGNDLRFRIKLTHRFDGPGSEGTIYFSLIKSSPSGYAPDRNWREPFTSARPVPGTDFNALIRDIATTMRDICDDPAKLGGEYNTLSYEEPWITYHRYFRSWDVYLPQVATIPPEQVRLTGNQLEAIDYVQTRDAKKVPRTSKDTYNSLRAQLQTKLDRYNLAVSQANNSNAFINLYGIQTVYIDEIIRNSEFEIGDVFQIGVKTGQLGHSVYANQSYWSITDASKNVDLWNQEID